MVVSVDGLVSASKYYGSCFRKKFNPNPIMMTDQIPETFQSPSTQRKYHQFENYGMKGLPHWRFNGCHKLTSNM